MPSSYIVSHTGVEDFDLAPAQLWTEITDVRRFERWWSWLRDLDLRPDRVAAGSVLTFSIVSPLPYSMRCRVDFDTVIEPELIRATVSGDLAGWATLSIASHGGGSRITLDWELEPTQRPMRLLVRAARPLIVRTKDWAVDVALGAFRRNVERS